MINTLRVAAITTSRGGTDLFAPKVRATDGFSTGGEEVVVAIALREDGALDVSETKFTAPKPGSWKFDASSGKLALSLESTGFERTFVTKGSLQSVFGGKDTSRTSSEYFIPVRIGTTVTHTHKASRATH